LGRALASACRVLQLLWDLRQDQPWEFACSRGLTALLWVLGEKKMQEKDTGHPTCPAGELHIKGKTQAEMASRMAARVTLRNGLGNLY
jgi:hypothetical protein